MKLSLIIMMCSLCFLLTSCQEQEQENPPIDKRLINTELINSFNDIAIQNAIISQHTLFPYHFVKNSAELNGLGQRDLSVLTAFFKENPGPLNIRRDGIASDIYDARVESVLNQLRAAGIDTELVTISDYMPGGSGMPSERILTILEKVLTTTPQKTTISGGM